MTWEVKGLKIFSLELQGCFLRDRFMCILILPSEIGGCKREVG